MEKYENAPGQRTWSEWEELFHERVKAAAEADARLLGFEDPAHDVAHFKRVVATAKRLAQEENGRMEIILPAAWLHDLVNVPKNDPRRAQASRLSAEAATDFLRSEGYPEAFLPDVAHAVAAHSFSARITPETLEAKIVQDADRLDGLGAVGVARVFIVGGLMKRKIHDDADPFARERELDDQEFTLDHFYVKLFKTAETMQTRAGREEGKRRAEFMREYLRQLAREIGSEARTESE